MRKLNYKLIVSDFDGTLLNDNNQVPESVKCAINEYVSAGGIFAVCTGRMLRSILPRVRGLGLKGLVAAYQGTVIADIESGKIIRSGGISCEDAAEVCKYLESINANINVYSDEVLYTNIDKEDKHLKLYEEITGVDAISVNGITDVVLKNGNDCQKIACLVAPEDRAELFEKIKLRFGNKFDVTCSAKVLVEISPYGSTKGEALKYLADHYGVDISRSIAVGDNLNDMSMVEAAGLGVAVGNAVEELKEAADFVAVTNNDGAVAQIIEKFGFV
ncbi:MAG: Cof-type HAD-IIB family hydrolase [Clostridia bacterium]|nr:Cof-type HAD-IIB family hydrolase [Clostridia bacterium]